MISGKLTESIFFIVFIVLSILSSFCEAGCEYYEHEPPEIVINCANGRSNGIKDCGGYGIRTARLSFRNCYSSDITDEMLQKIEGKHWIYESIDVSNIGLEKLSDAIFTGIHFTDELIAHHNRLRDLPMKSLVYWKYLDLSFNQFNDTDSIGEFGAYFLKTLILSNNNITYISDNAFEDVATLETLDLSFNNLNTLNVNAFEKLSNLRNLTLSHTNLSYIDLESFSTLTLLLSLDISGNRIKKIDIGLHSSTFFRLETLNLNENELVELNGLTRTILPHLSHLDLRGNRFNCTHLKGVLDLVDSHRLELPIDIIFEIEPSQAYRGLTCSSPLFDEETETVTNEAGDEPTIIEDATLSENTTAKTDITPNEEATTITTITPTTISTTTTTTTTTTTPIITTTTTTTTTVTTTSTATTTTKTPTTITTTTRKITTTTTLPNIPTITDADAGGQFLAN